MNQSKYRLNLETIRRLIRKDAGSNLSKLLQRLHPADIAEILSDLSPSEMLRVFSALESPDVKAEVLSGMPGDTVATILEGSNLQTIRPVLSAMAPDDVAAMLDNLSETTAGELQESMSDQELDKVEVLLTYPEETAGRIMTQEVFALEADLTVREALDRIRNADRAETVFYAYVIDDHRKLLGVVSLRRLLLESADEQLKAIMQSDVISVTPLIDQEEVAQIVARYDLLAVPVVDDAGFLLGIITVDDVIDIIHDEAREDIYRLAGSSFSEHEMKSPLKMAGVRIRWLSLRLLGALLCGTLIFAIGNWQHLNQTLLVLLSLFPAFISIISGIGTQSSTIIVEQLALRSDQNVAFWSLVRTELLIGLLAGLLFGTFTGVIIGGLHLMNWLAAALSGAILAAGMVVAMFLGTITPYGVLKIGRDPAIVTGSLISALLDLTAVVFFLGLCLFTGVTG